MLLHIKYLQSVLLVIILLNNVTGSNLRRRKMLVRRKVAINRNIIARTQTNGTVVADEKQIKRPVKVIKRKILGSNSEPRPVISQLSLPPVPEPETTTPSATILPQHKPFTVNETVPAKPDAVKRCRTKIYFSLDHNTVTKCFLSFVPVHDRVMEAGPVHFHGGDQWHVLLQQRVLCPGGLGLGHLRLWVSQDRARERVRENMNHQSFSIGSGCAAW